MEPNTRSGGDVDRRSREMSDSPFHPARGPDSFGPYPFAADGSSESNPGDAWFSRPLESSRSGVDYTQALGLDPPFPSPRPPSYPAQQPGPHSSSQSAEAAVPYGYYSPGPRPQLSLGPDYPLRRSPSRDSINSLCDVRESPALTAVSSSGYRSFQDHVDTIHSSPTHRDGQRPITPPSTAFKEIPGRVNSPPSHSFRPVVPMEPNDPSGKKGNQGVDPLAGVAVGFASLLAENLLSHPCTVLRRQCQVHHRSRHYHLTPFALIKVVMNIQRYQGLSTFWKGIGSTFIVKGMFLVSEHLISELTPFRREVALDSSTAKQLLGHVALKALAQTLVTPFFSAALVESVQSDIASERPGIFDCLREGSYRLVGYGMPQTTRLFPVYHLLLPTAAYGTLHYVIASVAQWSVISIMKKSSESVHRPSPQYGSIREESFAELTTSEGSTAALVESFYREVISGFYGNLLGDVILYPLETILHRLHLQGTRTIIDDLDSGLSVLPVTTRYEGVFDCYRADSRVFRLSMHGRPRSIHSLVVPRHSAKLRQVLRITPGCIVKEEGRWGLFKGFGALIIQYSLHFLIIKATKLLLDRITELSASSSIARSKRDDLLDPRR